MLTRALAVFVVSDRNGFAARALVPCVAQKVAAEGEVFPIG